MLIEITEFVSEYKKNNPDIPDDVINNAITELQSLKDQEIGLIHLRSEELDINEIADIFERINSKGVPLNQADFTMSKLASNTAEGGNVRKIVDYFSHLVQDPNFYTHIRENDPDFANSELFDKIAWVRDYGDAIYTFAVDCSIDQTGSMTFSVVSPESIRGIEGNIDGDKGTLTFDDEALLFELMTDNLLSPICAPWVAMNALRSGYIQSCGVDGEYIKILLDVIFF